MYWYIFKANKLLISNKPRGASLLQMQVLEKGFSPECPCAWVHSQGGVHGTTLTLICCVLENNSFSKHFPQIKRRCYHSQCLTQTPGLTKVYKPFSSREDTHPKFLSPKPPPPELVTSKVYNSFNKIGYLLFVRIILPWTQFLMQNSLKRTLKIFMTTL